MTLLHFLDFDVIRVMTRKTQTDARMKSLLGKVSLYFNKLLSMICWLDVPTGSMLENVGTFAHFTFTCEIVNKTDSWQSSGCNRPLV